MGYVAGFLAHNAGLLHLHVPLSRQSRIRFSDNAHSTYLAPKSSRRAISQAFSTDGVPSQHMSFRYAFGCSELSSYSIQTVSSPVGHIRGWRFEVRAKGDNGPAPQYRAIRAKNMSHGLHADPRILITSISHFSGKWLKLPCCSQAKIRSEVISPFRTVRMFFYLAFIASGSLGFLLTLPRLIGAIGQAANAAPTGDVLKDLGIDLAAVAVFAVLYRSDSKARDVQLAKLSREETLGALRVELANKKVVSLEQLRGLCRIVIVSGTTAYVEEALKQGEELRQELLERGVLVVPYPTDGALSTSEPASSSTQQGSDSGVAVQEQRVVTTASRWKANPIYTTEWARWLNEQKKIANVSEDKSVYISLRLDGRVRGSGVGLPPWKAFVAQLPPMKGMWKGPLDGMDGRI